MEQNSGESARKPIAKLAVAQVKANDLNGAIKTANIFQDKNDKANALIVIAMTLADPVYNYDEKWA